MTDEEQRLYVAWRRRWPLRDYLYAGVTNSPSRRIGEHRRNSEWYAEARVIRLKRYPDRESVLDAEELIIRAKRPRYNLQHNCYDEPDPDSDHECAGDGLRVLCMMTCMGVLGLRYLADSAAIWWLKRQTDRHGQELRLPPRRDPFTEPSKVLTLLKAMVEEPAALQRQAPPDTANHLEPFGSGSV